MIRFPTALNEILNRMDHFDPIGYSSSRNYTDGGVSYLSPYISRGVLSTRFVAEYILKGKATEWKRSLKFIQELAWRDYFQRVWQEKIKLDTDLRFRQEKAENEGIPKAICNASTGIIAIDKAIEEFYQTGYLHNHVRMYIASIAANIGHYHWLEPARWMYYHLLDADWGSNALNWQWVAGTFSHKKYYANQANINTYTKSFQTGTFLDTSYDLLPEIEIPGVLTEKKKYTLEFQTPTFPAPEIDPEKAILIYNFYNIDPYWHSREKMNRVLLIEPSFFMKYPVSEKVFDFFIELSSNIANIQFYTGEFSELQNTYSQSNFIYKEHPVNAHYKGTAEERDWLFPSVTGYHKSFSAYWKNCQKEIPSFIHTLMQS